ncbi:unnamed protein product [Calypogeia fissa]
MNLKVLFAVALLLAPAVQGYLVFQAAWGGLCDADELYSVLIDNGMQMCTMKGGPSYQKVYRYTCDKENYSALFDVYTGTLCYSTDHGNFSLPTNTIMRGHWTLCQWCSEEQCWVKTSISSEGCVPPSPYQKAPAPGPYHKARSWSLP